MMLYLLGESVTIGAILWAAVMAYRYGLMTRKLTSTFGRVYTALLFTTAIWWVVGAYLRFSWALAGSWSEGSHSLFNPWTIKWLGWWFLASVGYGFKTDMDMQTAKWEHWKDIMRSETLVSRSGVKSALLLLGLSVGVAIAMETLRT